MCEFKLKWIELKLNPEVTRSYQFLCVFARKFWRWAKERSANLFYFAVNTGHHFFQSTLECLQIEESLFGLFFVNCYLHMFAYSWSFYFNCECLIDYKSWLTWMLFCSILRFLFNTVSGKAISFLSFTLPKPDSHGKS